MNDNDFQFFKELIEAPSPSGYEQPAQRVMRSHLEGVADELRGDVMGNLIARVASPQNDAPRVMLAGHCDEIGFMVRYIDEQGFIWFGAIGGVDPHLVPGQRISIHTAAGVIPGVVGKKPIHLIEPKERETVIKLNSQFIDIGCSSREEVEKLVAIGDPITFAVGLERLQGDRVTSRAFDDKMGAFIVARVVQEVVRRGKPPVELFGVSTVQEEVGLRGGTTSAYGVNPDVGIAVEVGFATDLPDVNMKELGEVKVGGGPVITRGANINPCLFDLLVETAREESIPLQIIGNPRATGTDANVMQLSRGGVATGLVTIPLRYMHTPVETLALGDIEHAIQLLTSLIFRIDKDTNFVPR